MNQSAEQNTPPAEEMTEEQKQAWADYDAGVRRFTKVQNEENAKVQADREIKDIGSKSDAEFRELVRRQFGYDPF